GPSSVGSPSTPRAALPRTCPRRPVKDSARPGYDVVDSAEEFAQRYERLLDTVIDLDFFSGFCYTQFADTFQEANGLLNADRSPKLPLAQIKKSTGGSRTHIACGV